MGVKGIGRFSLKPRQNWRNIVGCAPGCVRLHTLLHVVACCWDLLRKSVKPFKLLPLCQRTQQLPTLLGQQCCELLRSFARSLSVLKPESITRVAEMQIKWRHSLKKKLGDRMKKQLLDSVITKYRDLSESRILYQLFALAFGFAK